MLPVYHTYTLLKKTSSFRRISFSNPAAFEYTFFPCFELQCNLTQVLSSSTKRHELLESHQRSCLFFVLKNRHGHGNPPLFCVGRTQGSSRADTAATQGIFFGHRGIWGWICVNGGFSLGKIRWVFVYTHMKDQNLLNRINIVFWTSRLRRLGYYVVCGGDFLKCNQEKLLLINLCFRRGFSIISGSLMSYGRTDDLYSLLQIL